MAAVQFTVTHHFDAPPSIVWDEMLDWEGHGRWIPATRVEVDPGDPRSVGATFTGYTGYGPATLVDRMEITELSWDAEAGIGRCVVDKLGPVLLGTAGFTLEPDGDGTRLEWFEDVTISWLPRLIAPIVDRMSALGFSFGMRRLAKVIAARPDMAASR
ncbi:MAG: SRPBCC family protein [Actinomycetota bacterium]